MPGFVRKKPGAIEVLFGRQAVGAFAILSIYCVIVPSIDDEFRFWTHPN